MMYLRLAASRLNCKRRFRRSSNLGIPGTVDPPDEPQRRNGVGGTHRQHLSPVRAPIQQFQQGTQGILACTKFKFGTKITIASMLKQTMQECPKIAPSTRFLFCLRSPKSGRFDSSPFVPNNWANSIIADA